MKRLALFLLLLLLPFSAMAQANKSIKVTSITLEATDQSLSLFDQQTLLRRLKTKEGTCFSQIEFDADLRFLATEFERVDPELAFNGCNVAITLVLHPKHRIHSIRWCGNHKVSTSQLEETLNIEVGMFFDRSAFNEAIHKVYLLYLEKSFFQAEVNYTLEPCGNEFDVVIEIREGPVGKVKHVSIEGLNSCEEEVVRERLLTQEYFVLTSWFTNKGLYIPEMAEYDRCMILDYLHNEGYADAKVRLTTQEVPGCDRINVVFCCEKGERFYFGEISFSGNCLFEDCVIEERIGCLEGEPFSPDALRRVAQKLQLLYGCKGYVESGIDFTPRLRHHCNIYDVHFRIREGTPYKVGFVKVFGNAYTKSTVILHESLLIPGECFDLRKLEATESRLKNVGYFDCVNVYPVRSQKTECDGWKYRDVNIEVKEASTGNVALSGGFSTLDSLFTSLELTERNFNHEGIFSVFSKGPNALRGNGEFLQMKGVLGTKTNSASLRWTKPYFWDTDWAVGFDVSSSRNLAVSQMYDLKQTGVQVFASHPFNAFIRYGWNYRYTNSEVDIFADPKIITPGMTPEEIAQVESYNRQLAQLEDGMDRHGVVSAFGPTVTYDSTDHPRRPRNGFRSQLLIEYAGLGGDFQFLSLQYLNTLYYSPFKKGTLKYRLEGRFIKTLGGTTPQELPLTERFFLGGDTTVRGFRGYAIGPELDGAPTGGISSVLASQEFMYPICKRIDGFVFVDGGSISMTAYTLSKFYISYGAGLRLEIMGDMPIIVGMGWPVNADSSSQVRRFFISFGGQF